MNEIIPGVPAALMERMSFLLKRAYALLEDAIELGLTQLNISGREFAVLTLIESEGPASQQRSRPCRRRPHDNGGACRRSREKGWSTASGIQQSARLPTSDHGSGPQETPRHSQAVKKAEQEILAPLSSAESATLTRLLQCLVQAQPPRT